MTSEKISNFLCHLTSTFSRFGKIPDIFRGTLKILAIDTSSSSGSIAVLEDTNTLSEWNAGSAGPHAIWLLPSIKALLERASLEISDIDLFAVTAGPGSFTGLRIGVSTIKGLAWPLKKKTLGVSTLAALSMNVPYSGKILCPVLDARKNEVYAALYDTSGGLARVVLGDGAMTIEALCTEISKRGLESSVVFLGTGLDVYSREIKERLPEAVLAGSLSAVRASAVGLLAFTMAGEAAGPERLSPVYLRKSEAEIKFG